MKRSDIQYQDCVKILKEELLPAMGCTEPIAVAYCAAVARKTLGEAPDRVVVEASGNIIKNVKSVIVPNTGHLRGIPAAAAAGIVAGNPDKQLEVIAQVSEAQQGDIRTFMETVPIQVDIASSPLIFDIIITVYAGQAYARVRIANYHTNIVLIEKNGQVLQSSEIKDDSESDLTDRSFLSVELIYGFANTVDIEDVRQVLDVQIDYNMAISEEGLKNDYGANIGTVLLKSGRDVMEHGGEPALRLKARAMAAAGSDARMNGCELPVIINSGLRHIKCCYLISVSCKKDCVFPFPAAHLKQPQRPGGIASAQKLQTHFSGHSSPIIFLNFITLFIRRYRFLFRDISHQRVDIRLQKPRQCGKKRYVGQRLGIFPLGNSLGRDAQPLCQLLLGISPGFPESCNIFCQP